MSVQSVQNLTPESFNLSNPIRQLWSKHSTSGGDVSASSLLAEAMTMTLNETTRFIRNSLSSAKHSEEAKSILTPTKKANGDDDWTINFTGFLRLIRMLPAKHMGKYLAYLDQCITEQQAGDARAGLRAAENAQSGSAATEAARDELRKTKEGFVGVVPERMLPVKRSAEELERYKVETFSMQIAALKEATGLRKEALKGTSQSDVEMAQIVRSLITQTFNYGQDESKPNKTVARISREKGWNLNQEQIRQVGRIASDLYFKKTGKRPAQNEGSNAAYPENVYEPEWQHLVEEAYEIYMKESDGGKRTPAKKLLPKGQSTIAQFTVVVNNEDQ